MYGEDNSSSTSDDDGDDQDTAMENDDQPPKAVPVAPQSQRHMPIQQPIIDADGFETVQKPSRRRGPSTHRSDAV